MTVKIKWIYYEMERISIGNEDLTIYEYNYLRSNKWTWKFEK